MFQESTDRKIPGNDTFSNLRFICTVLGKLMDSSLDLEVFHPRCDRSITQSCSVYISIHIHTVMNTTILQLVALYNIQLHVSVLYVGHHQVVQRTY